MKDRKSSRTYCDVESLLKLKGIYFAVDLEYCASVTCSACIYSPSYIYGAHFFRFWPNREEPSKSSSERCIHKKIMNSLLCCKTAVQHHSCGLICVTTLLIVLPVQFTWNVKWFLHTLSGGQKFVEKVDNKKSLYYNHVNVRWFYF